MLHLITAEYPPQPGGVGDYTKLVAEGLAAAGEEIHVWCSSPSKEVHQRPGLFVHDVLGEVRPADLRRASQQLDRFPAPRRLLVQWVPHAYGYRAMNLPFCLWLWKRSRFSRDQIDLMMHEVYLPFREGPWRQDGTALVQRVMTLILLQAAHRVWMSIPAWEHLLHPYLLGRRIPCQWLPIPSNIPPRNDPQTVQKIRGCYAPGKTLLIGHFGTFSPLITNFLEPILLAMKPALEGKAILLLGRGGEEFRSRLVRKDAGFENHIHATGALSADELSCHIAACDLLVQPYPDGVSTRRTSFMAGLSHGKPVVTTRGHLTESLWENCEPVRLARVGDVSGFTKLLEELFTDPGLRDRIGAAARKLYLERFDISHTIAALHPAVCQGFRPANSDLKAPVSLLR